MEYRGPLTLNESCEDTEHAYDQSCYWGHRVGAHAVYCHNPESGCGKCRNAWFTGGDSQDEDCEWFRKNEMAPADLAKHILKGEDKRQNTDYDTLHKKLQDEAKHLKGDFLIELVNFAAFLRARQGSRPYIPVVGERPDPADVTQEQRSDTGGQREPFDGKQANPMPIKGPCRFLPDCDKQYTKGRVVKCNNPDSEYYTAPCSKRCKRPVAVAESMEKKNG